MSFQSRDPIRLEQHAAGLKELSGLSLPSDKGRNGENLATDEAEVWKRVLSYRIADYLNAKQVLELHPALGVGSAVYRAANHNVQLFSLGSRDHHYDVIDIDPFGWPWESLNKIIEYKLESDVMLVTSGEIQAVVRRLVRAQKYKTHYYGKNAPLWVVNEYIPRLERTTAKKCVFFFAYPTMVRAVLTNLSLPGRLFNNCPKWMWWLRKYAP